MARVQDKVALVSGAAMGIGEACARLLAREGACVMITDVAEDAGRRVADDIGDRARFHPLDVTCEPQWRQAVAATVDAFGQLDVLVNNAGISEPGSIEDISLDDWRRTQDVNATGVFLGCKYAVETMKPHRRGSIVNVASGLSIRPGALFPAYSASKAAVRALTKSVALHCGEQGYNIRCNTVHPGAIHSPMLERYLDAAGTGREAALASFDANHPLGHCGQVDDIAQAVLYLASDEAKFVTGARLSVDGGMVL